MRPQSTVEGRPHATSPGPLHIPHPTVSHVKDLRGRDAGPPHRLGKDPMVGFADTNVRRGDNVGKPHPSGPLQERLPSRPRSGGVRDYDDGKSRPVQVSDESLGFGIEYGRMFLQPPFGVALYDLLDRTVY